MKLSIKLLSLFVLFFGFYAKSQSGYLGSTINVNASIDASPFFLSYIIPSENRAYTKVIELDTTFKTVELKRLVFRKQYNIGVDKVVSDKIQIGFQYSYQKFSMAGLAMSFTNTYEVYGSTYSSIEYTNLFSSIPIVNNSFTFRFKMFYQGIAPIGKYWGIDLNYSIAKSNSIIPIIHGERDGGYKSSRFSLNEKWKINQNKPINYDTLNYQGLVKALNIKFVFGRTIPITEKFGLDFSMIVPLLKIHFFNNQPHFIKNYTVIDLDAKTPYNLNVVISNHLRVHQSFMFNFGVRYFI